MNDIKIHTYRDATRPNSLTISAVIESFEFADKLLEMVLDKMSEHIAAEYISQFGPEIMARLNPEAIANLSLAAAGAKVNETLNKKMPDKILEVSREVIRKEVYQRGIFGGLKKL